MLWTVVVVKIRSFPTDRSRAGRNTDYRSDEHSGVLDRPVTESVTERPTDTGRTWADSGSRKTGPQSSGVYYGLSAGKNDIIVRV